jgi:hypothetical protein
VVKDKETLKICNPTRREQYFKPKEFRLEYVGPKYETMNWF